MDADRFDSLTRALVALSSRRAVSRALAGLTASTLAGIAAHPATADKGKHHKRKHKKKSPPPLPPPPSACTPPCFTGQQCCPGDFFSEPQCCPVCAPDGGCCRSNETCGQTCCPEPGPCDTSTNPPQCCPANRMCGTECCPPGETCDFSGDSPACCPPERSCDGECCPQGQACARNPVEGSRCCASDRICRVNPGTIDEIARCCDSTESLNGCCPAIDAEGHPLVLCCYGTRSCMQDEDNNSSCCLPGQTACGGSCCPQDSFCCARTKNGIREYACCPTNSRCMKDRPDLRPCCSNC